MSINQKPTTCYGLLYVALTALLPLCRGDEFTSPSNSKTDLATQYTLGQTVQLSWDTALEDITLLVSHWGGNDVGSLLSDAKNPGVYTWVIGQDDNVDDAAIADSPNFVLLIRDPSGQVGTGGGFVNNQLSSRAFIIKSNATTTTSFSTSSTAASSSTSSTAATTSAAAATETPPPNPSPGLSTAAKAGIGVAAGVGALALLAVGIFVGIKCVRKTRRQSNTGLPAPPHTRDGLYEVGPPAGDPKKPLMGQYSYSNGVYVHQTPTELPPNPVRLASTGVHEMGSGS